MAFCPICKRNHDLDLNCTDGTAQTLRDMGIKEQESRMSKEEFNKLNRKALTYLILVALGIALLFIAVLYKMH